MHFVLVEVLEHRKLFILYRWNYTYDTCSRSLTGTKIKTNITSHLVCRHNVLRPPPVNNTTTGGAPGGAPGWSIKNLKTAPHPKIHLGYRGRGNRAPGLVLVHHNTQVRFGRVVNPRGWFFLRPARYDDGHPRERVCGGGTIHTHTHTQVCAFPPYSIRNFKRSVGFLQSAVCLFTL